MFIRRRSRHFTIGLSLLFVASLLAELGAVAVSAAAPAIPVVARMAMVEQRAPFGLPVDDATLGQLYREDSGRGLARVAITDEEFRALDFDGRMDFQVSLLDEFIPFVTSQSTFAGGFFDQTRGGEVTVLLTESTPEIVDGIRQRYPAGGPALHIRDDAEHTWSELRNAADLASARWGEIARLPRPIQLGIDTAVNGLVIAAPLGSEQAHLPAAAAVQAATGVATHVIGSWRGLDTLHSGCVSRDNCDNPLHPGIRIAHNDSTVDDCTMGWHI